MKRRQRVAKATRRERKTFGYLGLESHFHADDKVRIWPSGVDWLIFFQTRKPIWLARLIVTTEGTLRIFTRHFASLYQGRKLFVCCTPNNICTGPRHVKARHISRFWHGCCSWKNIRRNFDQGTYLMSAFLSVTEQQKKALFAALRQKDVFTTLSAGYGKYIIFQSLPDVCK